MHFVRLKYSSWFNHVNYFDQLGQNVQFVQFVQFVQLFLSSYICIFSSYNI